MARRLVRGAGVLVLALCICEASACANASDEPADSTLASIDVAASVTTAILRSLNDAVVDDYVLQNQANAAGPLGAAQPCRTADNRLSQRPSALANPPYAEASIVQRDRVVRVLGAYALLVETVSRDAANADADFAAAEFERAAFALSAAANVHAQGDLFVEDRAATLAAITRRPREAHDATAIRDMVVRANPTVQQLIAVARADVAKRRLEAIAAMHLQLRDLLVYAASPSPTPSANAVFCSKPLVGVSDAAPAAVETDVSASIALLPPGLRSRAQRIRERASALSAVDFDRFFEALNEEARAASALPFQRSRIEEAANGVQRASAAVGKDGLPLTFARL